MKMVGLREGPFDGLFSTLSLMVVLRQTRICHTLTKMPYKSAKYRQVKGKRKAMCAFLQNPSF